MYDCSAKQHIPFLTLLAQRKSRKSVVYQRVCAICTFPLTLSRIPAAKTYHFVTMYYFHPFRLAKSSIATQNRSHHVNDVCNGSPSRMRRVLRISLGMTILPKSSTRLTMPVAFIISSPLVRISGFFGSSICRKRGIMYDGVRRASGERTVFSWTMQWEYGKIRYKV